ncbi:MAG: hypothetical protein GC168_03385 [Candidatus Hydrogenedens sp.]|nr:hypothetical protein [Candidatus Hydrogenedens sp.]
MRVLPLIALAALAVAPAWSVEPTTTDSFGNPEEPAMRIYKWVANGVLAVPYQTLKGLRDGNMNTPVVGSVEALRGAGIGVIELGNQSWNGLLFAPLEKDEFKQTHKWNEVIDNELLLRNVRDAASTLPLYPVQKLVDKKPAESDEKVRIRLDNAEEIREKRAAAAQERDPYQNLDRRERAQMRYVPGRAEHGLSKKQDTTGNLLKLAK